MAARGETSKLKSGLLAGAAVALAAGLLHGAGLLRPLELKLYDLRMQAVVSSTAGDPKADPSPVHPDLVIVNLSEESIEWMKAERRIGWPWDRRQIATLLRALGREDFPSTAVCFDFFTFCDLDPYGGDAEAARAIEALGSPVYLAVPFRLRRVETADRRPDLERLLDRYAVKVETDGSVQAPEGPYESVILPVPGVAQAAAGVCDVETREDADGTTRAYRMISRWRGRHFPSFALAALMAREGAESVAIRNGTLVVGKVSVPLRPDGTIQLRYYRPGSFRVLAADRVIRGFESFERTRKVTEFDPSTVQDKIVLVGTNAAALFDLKVTPVAEAQTGVEIHAIALANVLRGDRMRDVPGALSWGAILAAALGTALATRLTGPLAGGLAALAALAGFVALDLALFARGSVLVLGAPSLAIVLSYATGSALNFLFEGRQRQRVKREFQRYLSPRVVDKILKNPDALSLEGERKTLTIFFMDFAGFTSMSEKLDPAELVALISEYHNEAAEEIFRTEGTVDKYIGDAIMAFWNDPIEQPDHAVRACLSAAGAQKRLRVMAEKMRTRGLPEMTARIGINTGIATVGNMGARDQVNYTVIGDEVNLASRLEGVNKVFGTSVILSEGTYGPAADRVEARELALIKVKGKKLPVRIFELLGLKGDVEPRTLERARAFEAALALLRGRRFAEARTAFEGLAASGDPPSAAYVDHCRELEAEPPPADWDESYEMKTK